MATYISLVQFTDKVHAAKETTGRVAEWAAKVQSKGVNLKHMYWTLGHYDQVCVLRGHQTTKRLPACCCPRTCWATFGRRRYVLLPASRWRRFSRTFLDRGESKRFCERAGRLLLDSYDRGASRPAVVVCWITSRRSALVSRPLARVHHRTIGEAIKMDE